MSAPATAPAALQQQVVSMQQTVGALKIMNAEQYLQAAEVSKGIAALRKEVANTFDPIIAKAHAAHKEACEQKRKVLSPLEDNQKKVDTLILAWDREQERVRREEEERQRAEAKRLEDERAIQEAEQLQAQGEHELADHVLETQACAPAPMVSIPSSVPKVQGLAKRVNWRWRVKNADLIPRQYLMPDEVAIGGVVRSLKDKTQILGIEVYSEDSAIHR